MWSHVSRRFPVWSGIAISHFGIHGGRCELGIDTGSGKQAGNCLLPQVVPD